MRKRGTSYAIAIAITALAVLARWLLDPLMGDTLPLVTLFGAVAVAVWVGGYKPAILAAVLGYVACNFLFILPRDVLATDTTSVVGLAAYVFTCSLIIAIGEAMRSSRARAREQRELLRVTLHSIGDAVITTDLNGRVTYLNTVAVQLTGWSEADAIGQPLDVVFHIVNEATRATVESPATRALSQGVVVGLANHTILVRRDGSECPIDDSAAPIADAEGRVSGCVLVFRDVSAQRKLERERASQFHTARLLASIVESSDDAIVSKGLDGTIRSWNAGAERVFGWTAEQAIGKHISLIIPPERLAEEAAIIAQLQAGQRVDHFETERLRSDGRLVPISLTVSPLRDEAGRIVGASKIARDITERKRLEDGLRQLAADLSEADRRKTEFLATLSHELRGPLAPLSNMLEVLKRADDETAVLPRARVTIERQLGQLIRLVDDLMDLSRITHNRMELRWTRASLSTVIDHAVEAARPLVDALGHDLRVTMPERECYLHADPARLAQVFGNLLNNACKYTNPGGRIRLAAECDDDTVTVSISDTGAGIPADKLDSIFEMFAQVDRPLERSQGGLGIGLTLVKRLVEMHGGSIEARSEGEQRGSEFVVRLPTADRVARAGRAPQEERAPTPEPPSRAHRILVVDDNEDAANSLAMLLRMSGNETYVAHQGADALRMIQELRPDVALLDIGLPDLDGHDVCRRIRAEPWGRDILLIALTGWSQDEDRRKSQEAGFDAHLVKPVDYPALTALLRERRPSPAGA